MNNQFKEALQALITSIKYMIEQTFKNTTQIYDGIIVSVNGNKYEVRFNGNTYNIKLYGNNTHQVNDIVKVFIPQGNMNLAFFI